MFTRRPSACPRLTELLREAFELLPDETQREVELLSISVDPDHDRPAVLKEFARKHRADRAAWRFVHVEARELATLSEDSLCSRPARGRSLRRTACSAALGVR